MSTAAQRILAAPSDLLEAVDRMLSRTSARGKYEIFETQGIVVVEFKKNSIVTLPVMTLGAIHKIADKFNVALQMFCDRGYLVWHLGA